MPRKRRRSEKLEFRKRPPITTERSNTTTTIYKYRLSGRTTVTKRDNPRIKRAPPPQKKKQNAPSTCVRARKYDGRWRCNRRFYGHATESGGNNNTRTKKRACACACTRLVVGRRKTCQRHSSSAVPRLAETRKNVPGGRTRTPVRTRTHAPSATTGAALVVGCFSRARVVASVAAIAPPCTSNR